MSGFNFKENGKNLFIMVAFIYLLFGYFFYNQISKDRYAGRFTNAPYASCFTNALRVTIASIVNKQ